MSITRFHVLSAGANDRTCGAEGMNKLALFLDENTKYLHEAAPVFYRHLNPQYIPQDGDYSANWTAMALGASAIGHLLRKKFYENPSYMTTLHTWWPNICKWLDLFSRYCTSASTPVQEHARRFLVMRLDIALKLVADYDTFLTADIVLPIFHFWIGMCTNPALSSIVSCYPGLRYNLYMLVDELLAADEIENPQVAPTVKQTVTEHLELFVDIGVGHVEEQVKARSEDDGLNSSKGLPPAYASVMILNALFDFDIDECTLSVDYDRLVAPILDLFTTAAQSPLDPSTADTMLMRFVSCIEVFEHAADNAKSNYWLLDALQLGLLDIITSFRPWIIWGIKQKGISAQNASRIGNFITNSFCQYLIHPSVVHAAAKALRRVNTVANTSSHSDIGSVTNAWLAMEHTILERRKLLDSIRPSCANTKCSSINRKQYYRCAGCNDVDYCSRACQKADWKHGDHRTSCLLRQELDVERDRDIPHMTSREREFLEQIVLDLLDRNHEAIRNLLSTFIDVYEEMDPTICVNLIEFPAEFTISAHHELDPDELHAAFDNLPAPGGLLVAMTFWSGSESRVEGMAVDCPADWTWKGKRRYR